MQIESAQFPTTSTVNMDRTGLTVLDMWTQPTEILVIWPYYHIISSKTRLFFIFLEKFVQMLLYFCWAEATSIFSVLATACQAFFFTRWSLYSWQYLSHVARYVLISSINIRLLATSSHVTYRLIRHFESKELWEKSSCYVIHCVCSCCLHRRRLLSYTSQVRRRSMPGTDYVSAMNVHIYPRCLAAYENQA